MHILSLLLSTAAVSAVQYGNNHVTVRRDPDVVAAQFQDIDYEILSPAFLHPERRLPGFTNGTQGPTSLDDMSESFPPVIANPQSPS